ncbi:MAG: VOC family protein, partial [SAR324 cluster bacterium]|nr:VOC family protein [SAR324 cluster bacterium]
MKYLHTMIRVQNLESALDFFINKLGMMEVRRREAPEGRFTLVFLATGPGESTIELTYNWDQEEPYTVGRNF